MPPRQIHNRPKNPIPEKSLANRSALMSIKLPKYIDDFQLMNLEYQTENDSLKFELINPIKPQEYYKIEMQGVIHVSISKDLEANDNNFDLGHFKLSKTDGKTPPSEKNTQNPIHPEHYPEESFYHLDIDGFITIQAIGTKFTIQKEDNK